MLETLLRMAAGELTHDNLGVREADLRLWFKREMEE
jgi:hypothetical protein